MNWQYIILHHTATPADRTVEQIRAYHIGTRGYLDIAYNWIVDRYGTVHEGRPLDMAGAHTYGYNKVAIGIAAIGNFEEHAMPEAQRRGVVEITRRMMDEHSIPLERVMGHRDVLPTTCPGRYFPMDEIKKELEVGSMGAFKDVNKDAWYAGPIDFCNQKGLMGGYPDGTFKPGQGISRGEIASLAARIYMLTSEEERAMKVWDDCSESVVVVRAKGGGGSGFFVDDKMIVTNAHVVNGVNEVTITTKNQGSFIGEVQRRGAVWDDKGVPQAIGSNKLIDLATVKLIKKADDKAVWGDGFKSVKFATEVPQKMSFLVLIGNPLLIEFWGSYGVVSRTTNYYIDTDAAINPGNSGGAGFNLDGEFVGVPTQKYTGAEIDNMGALIRFDAVKLWLEGRTDEIQF